MYKKRFVLLTFCLILILLPARGIFAQEQQPNNSNQNVEQALNNLSQSEYVIAHHSPQNNELTLNELRSIFSLRARKWPDGTPITVFVLRDEHEVHRQFMQKTLKMLPHQLRRQWDRYIYSGIGQGPTVVESQEEMLSKVKSTPGGIGYIEGGVSDGPVHMLSIR
jgi:hypothetical protein